MWVLITHLLLAIGLFIVVNWIGKHSVSYGYMQLSIFYKPDESPAFNYLFRIAAPLVYILLVSSALYALGLDSLVRGIYQVVIYYFLFRLVFNLIFERAYLLNWNSEILIFLISTLAAYQLYAKVISTKQRLLPDPDTISNELWIIVLVFLYGVSNSVRISSEGTEKRKSRHLRHYYVKYQKKYGAFIRSKVENRSIEALVYAIMIYESFNRPRVVRGLERLLFGSGQIKTLGIMQVTTDRIISDDESVALGVAKILNDYKDSYDDVVKTYAGSPPGDLQILAINETVTKYNSDSQYQEEVLTLRETIRDEFYDQST